jgi:hypothetical protein
MDSDFGFVAQQLADRIEALVEQLLPGGVLVNRRYWRVGSLSGEPGQSLCVYLTGAKRGRWKDFDGSEHGDALDLVAAVLFPGNLVEAIKWARDWLGISQETDPETKRQLAERAAKRRAELQRQAERENAHKRQDALQIWLAGAPVARGDIVDRYLRTRGIDLARLGKVPGALRTHPSLRHADGSYWPAMVAAICDVANKHVAVHRTWLKDGPNFACDEFQPAFKAPVTGKAKMTLGSYAGGCIRLSRGASGKPWSQILPGEKLLIGEGIEDVLSAMIDWPEFRAVCGVSLSSMLCLELPETVGEILLLHQGDPIGSPAYRTLWEVISRFEAMGHPVRLWKRNAGVKDYNEAAIWRQNRIANLAL